MNQIKNVNTKTNSDNTTKTTTTTSKNPQTSDDAIYMIYIIGMILSGLYFITRKRKYND